MGVGGRSQRHTAWNCHEGLRSSSWHSEEGSGTLVRYIYSHPHPHFEEVFTTRGGELDEGSDDVMFYKRAGSRLGLWGFLGADLTFLGIREAWPPGDKQHHWVLAVFSQEAWERASGLGEGRLSQ